MRTLIALALVLVACGPSDRRDRPTGAEPASTAASSGPDPVVVRVAHGGGLPRAYAYPNLDSAVWTGQSRVRPVQRFLGFDDNAGVIAYVDDRGAPSRLNLQDGSAGAATSARLVSLTQSGPAIYGVSEAGSVVRLTSTDQGWHFTPSAPARSVFPQNDGSLVVVGTHDDATLLWRVHPPETKVLDSLVLPRTAHADVQQLGDRLYLANADELIGVRAKDLTKTGYIEIDAPIMSVAPTPSGDRLYALTADGDTLIVVDRYEEKVTSRIPLAHPAHELRMDPLGRLLLARLSAESTLVFAVATDSVRGTIRTDWRADLPLVAPDGAVLIARNKDVLRLDPRTLEATATVKGGALDVWDLVLWNGFRPRSPELDTPVVFAGQDSAAAADSAAATPPGAPQGESAPPAPPRDTANSKGATAPAPAPAPASSPVNASGYTVSLAALLTADKAAEVARQIVVNGTPAHVVSSVRGTTTIYRVVLGPFATRSEAERVGRDSHRDFWIYQGAP